MKEDKGLFLHVNCQLKQATTVIAYDAIVIRQATHIRLTKSILALNIINVPFALMIFHV